MSRKIVFADFLEKEVATALDEVGIDYLHASEVPGQLLDFYIKDYHIYIEIKQYFTDRIIKQLAVHEEVILLQGKKAVRFFINQLRK
jgi:hypothetical protein